MSRKVSRSEMLRAKIDILGINKKIAYRDAVEKLYDEGVTSFVSSVEITNTYPENKDLLLYSEIIWTFEYDKPE